MNTPCCSTPFPGCTGHITACNDNPARNLHLPERPLGRALGDILCPLEDESFSLLVSRQDNTLLPQIFKVCYTDILYKCYCFGLENGFLVLGDRMGGTDNEVLQSMSLLNNELSGLSRELSRTDSLTGLANRRYFKERYDQAFTLARRHKTPLSVAMLDLDHFKTVNDNFGHEAGDTVLRELGQLLRQNCRHEDFAARFGGEEFIMYLSHTTAEEARELAERLREIVAQADMLEYRHRVTVSIGLSHISDADSPEALIKRADQALYAAKKAGRNRTSVL